MTPCVLPVQHWIGSNHYKSYQADEGNKIILYKTHGCFGALLRLTHASSPDIQQVGQKCRITASTVRESLRML